MEIRRIRPDDLDRAAALSPDPEAFLRHVRLLRDEGEAGEDWVILALDGDRVLGRVGFWRQTSDPGQFHFWGVRIEDDRAGVPLFDRLVTEARAEGAREIKGEDTPGGRGDRDDVLRGAGFEILQEKLRFVRDAATAPPVPATAPGLEFRPLSETGEEAFVDAMRLVTEGTLDRDDRESFREVGPERGAREYFALLKEIDFRPEWWLLGYDGGEIVGLVVPHRFSERLGALNYVGVVPARRGRGHGRQLLTEGTRILVDAGVRRIIGDIDQENFPLASALPELGYRQERAFRIWRRRVKHE